jgi:phosphate transport system substrate-binding protein
MLPDAAIEVVHRSDGSGTTFVWTSFLASASAEWKNKAGAIAEWPVGIGELGNEGVAGEVEATENTIGYVELTYAIQHKLSAASVRNPAGHFVQADLRSISAAAQSAKVSRTEAGGSLLNEPGSDAYPITTFTYLLVRKTNPDAAKQAGIADVLRWMLTSGQKQCSSLGYAPLPRALADSELELLKSLKP